MEHKFSPNGLIGKSGKWYPCGIREHDKTGYTHNYDAPFAVVHQNLGGINVTFDAYYTCEPAYPTQAQYETLLDWCTDWEEKFEDVTDCWNLPWQAWRDDNYD